MNMNNRKKQTEEGKESVNIEGLEEEEMGCQ